MKKIILFLASAVILFGCTKFKFNYNCTCVTYKVTKDGYNDTIRTTSKITVDKNSCYSNDTVIINIGDIITVCK